VLPENEIAERLEYCYLVYCQLTALQMNESVEPPDYLPTLKKSSLRIEEDGFIGMTLKDGLIRGVEDGGLSNLISLYEGFVHAFCEVLETDLEDVKSTLPLDILEKIIGEVNPKAKL